MPWLGESLIKLVDWRKKLSREVMIWVFAAIVLLPLRDWRRNELIFGAEGHDAKVEALISAGHWKRARAILEPEVKAHPDNAQECYLLAEVKFTFNDLDGALPLAQHAVELDGKNSNYHLKLGQIYGEMAARASFFSAGSLAVKFRKEVEIAIQLDPNNLDALDSMMQFKFRAPSVMGGSKDEARALAEKIATLNVSQGYLAQAELAELEKDPAKMEADYLKAVQANPKSYDALTELAKFYSQPSHANYEQSTKRAQEGVRLDPNQIEAYRILARDFAEQARWEDLQQDLAAAEKNVPDDLSPYYEAAQPLSEAGKELPRAEGYAKKYLSQEPEGGEPDKAEAHRLLGLIYEKEGKNDEARAELQTAIKLRPNFKAAKDDLKNLGN
jgi:tetratricopeptide (TPR) repeat protein